MSYGLAQDSVSLSVADDALELTWQMSLGEQMELCLEAKNIGRGAVAIDEFCVLDVDAEYGGSLALASPTQSWRFFQNGWQSLTPAFARHISDGIWVNPNTVGYRTKHQPHALSRAQGVLSSEWFTVIVPRQDIGKTGPPPSDSARLLGFTSTANQLAEIRLQLEGAAFKRLQAISYADGSLLPVGHKLSSETLLFATAGDPLALMDLYATRLGDAMRARVPTDASAWCSRCDFVGKDTSVDIRKKLTHLQEEQLPPDVVLIGDGYQSSIGDWLDVDSTRYPQGMKHVAHQIAAAGYRPGIWIAPFVASASSKLCARHPDWILHGTRGAPVLAARHQGTDLYALDPSLPAVQTWLQDVFHTLSEEWGFAFFEVDLLYAAALPAVPTDPQMTRARAVRAGLEIIRAAIGERFLLASGAPLGPAVGLVDAMRIGPDVQADWYPYWQDLSAPSTANSLLNSITRGFMHRRLWLNAPGTPKMKPHGDGPNLTLNEMRTLITVMGLMGSLALDRNSLASMGRGAREHWQRVLPPYGQSALPLDLFEHERPRLLALPVQAGWGSSMIVALLNWGNRSCVTRVRLSRLGLPPAPHHVYNYWRQRYLGVVDDDIVISPHRPHEAALLLIKPVSNRPEVLTSTFHVLQGAVEIQDAHLSDRALVVEMEKPGKQFGRLLFAVPPEQPVVGALVSGRSQRPREISSGIWQLGFSLRDKATVELLFG